MTEKDSGETCVKDQLKTVEGAQGLINGTLAKIHQLLARPNMGGEGLDDYEAYPDDLAEALSTLRFAWFTLPAGAKCISVGVKFNRVEGKPKTGREFELRQLQRLLGIVGVEKDGAQTSFEFVVQPPCYPPELRGMHFGSDARSSSEGVRETLKTDRSNELNVLEVRPHGVPKGMESLRGVRPVDFRVPLAQVKYIKLETEEKPLTPWIEIGTKGEVVREVAEV